MEDQVELFNRGADDNWSYELMRQTKFYVIKSTNQPIRWNMLNGGLGYDGVLGLSPMNWKTHHELIAESNFVNKLHLDG